MTEAEVIRRSQPVHLKTQLWQCTYTFPVNAPCKEPRRKTPVTLTDSGKAAVWIQRFGRGVGQLGWILGQTLSEFPSSSLAEQLGSGAQSAAAGLTLKVSDSDRPRECVNAAANLRGARRTWRSDPAGGGGGHTTRPPACVAEQWTLA